MEILRAVHLKKYYGSGKTTLLNLIGGLDYADAGEVIIDGHSVMEMSKEELTVFRRRNIGFVFQNYNLISVQNVYKNIVLPIRLDGNQTIIMITHNDAIAQLADRVIHIEDGRLVREQREPDKMDGRLAKEQREPDNMSGSLGREVQA